VLCAADIDGTLHTACRPTALNDLKLADLNLDSVWVDTTTISLQSPDTKLENNISALIKSNA